MSLRLELSDRLTENAASDDCNDCSEHYYNDLEQHLEQQQPWIASFPISRVSILGRGSSATVYKSVLLHKLR